MKKFIEFKNKWSAKLPTFADDTQKHYFVIECLLLPTCIIGAFLGEQYALIGIGFIFLGAVLWEVLGFIENGFNATTRSLAYKDIATAWAAIFRPFVVFLILATT